MNSPDTIIPTAAEARAAAKSLHDFPRSAKAIKVRMIGSKKRGDQFILPAAVVRVLRQTLSAMADGQGITLLPAEGVVTTQQAAALLHVSRPHVIELLERGDLPFHKVGSHRRVRLKDVLAYKKRVDAARLKTLGKLTAQAQELGMGY